jgi:multidrug efflux pump subunit AcrA (membrane-fusion protein)
VAYEVQRDLLEAQRVRRVREIELTSAERSLYVLGLTADDIHYLEKMEQQDDPTGACDDPDCPTCRQEARVELATESKEASHVCDDPNCQDCAGHAHAASVAAVSETCSDCSDPNCPACAEHVHASTVAVPGNTGCACGDPDCQECATEARGAVTVELPETGGGEQRLAWYPVRAPFAGTVISKHLSTGEFVKDDAEVFVIADLDTVWVDFQVHQKDLAQVREGQRMQVQIGSGLGRATGRITYVSPLVDVATRTAWARVVLANVGRKFRPGLFVTGTVAVDRTQAPIAVADSAVQYIEDKPCVFVYDDEHFHKRDVVLGRADNQRVEILSGLERDEMVAVNGSFHIKAEIEKQLSGGAGHGHMH